MVAVLLLVLQVLLVHLLLQQAHVRGLGLGVTLPALLRAALRIQLLLLLLLQRRCRRARVRGPALRGHERRAVRGSVVARHALQLHGVRHAGRPAAERDLRRGWGRAAWARA